MPSSLPPPPASPCALRPRFVAKVTLACLALGLGALAQPAHADEGNAACLAAHEQSQRLRMDNHLLAARTQLLVCAQTECPRLVTDDCVGWLSEVEQSLASIVFAVSDERGNDIANARIWNGDAVLAQNTDGHALTLDPGSYALRVEHPGYAPVTLQLAVRQSEKNRIVRVQLSPLLQPAAVSGGAPIPIASYVLGGVALVSAAVGTYFAFAGNHEYNKLERQCSPACSASQVAPGKRDYVIADVAFGVATASAVASVLVYFIDRESPSRPPAANVQAAVTPHAAYLQLRTQF